MESLLSVREKRALYTKAGGRANGAPVSNGSHQRSFVYKYNVIQYHLRFIIWLSDGLYIIK